MSSERGGVEVIPITRRGPRIARKRVRQIFQRNRFAAVTAVGGDHYHRARETEFDDAHLVSGDGRDLAVTHHEYGGRSPTVDERLPPGKRATEVGGALASGRIKTTGDGAGQ